MKKVLMFGSKELIQSTKQKLMALIKIFTWAKSLKRNCSKVYNKQMV